MKTQKMKLLLLIAVFCLGWTFLEAQPIEKTFTGIEEINMEISSGDVFFTKSSSTDVSIKLEHTFNIDYNPTMEKRGSRLVIEEAVGAGSYSGTSTWTIQVPDNTEIEFSSGSSDVDISGLTVQTDMNSGSGNYKLHDVKGEFEINTGSGNIEAKNMNGRLKLNSGSGDIMLDNVVSAINVNVGSGDIQASPLTISGSSSFNSSP